MSAADGIAPELLSGYVDGELDADEAATVSSALGTSPELRREIEAIQRLKAELAALGPVEPPADFLEHAIRRSRATRYRWPTIVSVIATAAMWIAVVAVGLDDLEPVSPDTEQLASFHADVVGGGTGSLTERPELSQVTAGALPSGHWVPRSVGGMSVQAVFHDDSTDLTQVVYGDGAAEMSVFQQLGELDPEGLPEGEWTSAGDREIWLGESGAEPVAVFQAEDLVLTVVGNDGSDAEELADFAAEVPDPPGPSIGARLRDTLDELVEGVGFS